MGIYTHLEGSIFKIEIDCNYSAHLANCGTAPEIVQYLPNGGATPMESTITARKV